MAYNAPSIVPYNYNANPPPDDGSRTAANRVSWAKVRTALSDPLRSWMDAINNEIARAFVETSEFQVPVGTLEQNSAFTGVSGRLGLNATYSTVDFARLFQWYGSGSPWSAAYGVSPPAGTFHVPPAEHYFRPGGPTLSVYTRLANQNKAHTHTVTDPGHSHFNNVNKWNNSGQQTTGGTRASDPQGGWNTEPSFTGVTVNSDGGAEARPDSVIVFGVVKY